jgi:hypothetical protein
MDQLRAGFMTARPAQQPAEPRPEESSQRASDVRDAPLALRILENGLVVWEGFLVDTLELGRQRVGEPGRYSFVPASDGASSRLIIANAEETSISRRHLLFLRLPCDVVRVTNLGRVAVPVQGGFAVLAQQTIALDTPVALCVYSQEIRIGNAVAVSETDLAASLDGTLGLGSCIELLESVRTSAVNAELQIIRTKLLLQIQLKFGELPPAFINAINGCQEIALLRSWLDRIATAQIVPDIGIPLG